MRTFLIDDEQALCRYLASKEWTRSHFTQSDKDLQEKMRLENKKQVEENFTKMLDGIDRTGRNKDLINWEYLKKHQPKRYVKELKKRQKQLLKERMDKEIA